MSSLDDRFLDAVSAVDSLVEQCVDRDARLDDGPPARAAEGPATASDPDSWRIALEQIREGHLLHGHGGRFVMTDDADLALLAGDALYARGLGMVAGFGDAEAIGELSRLIVTCAVARASGEPDAAERAWAESCSAIGGLA